MEVFTINRVKGIIATSKIMNGNDLTILIIGFNILKINLFSIMPPERVTTSKIPKGIPIIEPMIKENPTI